MTVVSTTRTGRVLVITLRREHKRNAIDQEMTDGIEAAVDVLEGDDELWCGVLTGTTTLFSAGTDLTLSASPTTERGGQYGLVRRERVKPLVAGVDGWALGGGFELALACDILVAGEGARFGLPEVARGGVANSGALFRAPRALPRHVAADLLLSGEPITARRAYDLGLVTRLCPDGTAGEAATSLAQAICANSPVAVRATLAALRRPAVDDAEGWRITADAVAATHGAQDTAEGVRAFLDKRPPVWTGR